MERWDVTNNTIDSLEKRGVIKRISSLPGVRFPLKSIEFIECDDTYDEFLMAKEIEITKLKAELSHKIEIINKLKLLLLSIDD